MDDTNLFIRYGVALAIGTLIGLQREFVVQDADDTRRIFAGIRTFALLSLLGCGATHLSQSLQSPLPFVGIATVIGGLLVVAYYLDASAGKLGMTTEIAALIALLAGAIAYSSHIELAIAFGVVTMALLALKVEMHTFVRRISRDDILATVKFAIITAIVLPVLPNRTWGPEPFDVVNPQRIWARVVIISAVTYLGYILVKIVGARRGVGLTGLLGGLASSTAVTLSFAGRSRNAPELSRTFAFAIISAWTVMFGRVFVVVALVNGSLARVLWPPLLVTMLAGVAYSTYLFLRQRGAAEDGEDVTFRNPFELRQVLYFGLILATVLLLSRTGQHVLGNSGVFITSAVAGLANTDAVALSVSELNRHGLELTTATRAIVLAIVANSLGKGLMAMGLGSPQLRRAILPGVVLMVATGVTVLLVFVR